MSKHLFVAASIAVLTLVGYFQFPGHTFLHSDTQIYMPMLERYWDPTVLSGDMLAQRPHVSFTIYDEIALTLRNVTGLGFREVLTIQQLLLRALGIFGVFLIATSLKLSTRMALLVAAIFSLGARIGGPIVLTIEYEPVPRAFAVPLVLLAIGLVAHGRDFGAGLAASIAFLYQAPAVCTFWAVYFCLSLWPTRPPVIMSRRILGLVPLLCAVIIMLFLSRLQMGVTEPQLFFSHIDPSLEKLQRMRGSYNWVSMWTTYWFWHYGFLWVVSLGAFLRIRKFAYTDLKFFLIGMPILGALSVPTTYLLLDKIKWGLIPQIQPARAVLFVTVLAGTAAAVAAVKAAQSRRFWESILWFAVTFAIHTHPRVLNVLLPDLGDPLIRRRTTITLILAAAATFVAWIEATGRKWQSVPWTALVLVPFFLIPAYGEVRNYPNLTSPELAELCEWARNYTPKDAMFLFPDAGRQLYPGIFRANSLRAVYVDWKSGGQVNFLGRFGQEWWKRWQQTMAPEFDPAKIKQYSKFGIDYVVVDATNRVPDQMTVFENSEFVVYHVSP